VGVGGVGVGVGVDVDVGGGVGVGGQRGPRVVGWGGMHTRGLGGLNTVA
jgi:hypothetical protein